jgi:glycosyltransferase involved in cell wall biosynthesis
MNPSTNALRISIVAPSTRILGGQSVQADLLMRHWRCDPAVSARFVATDPEMPAWLAWVERIRYLRTVFRIPFYLAELWRGTRDADIVHIFSASYWAFALASVPAWLTARMFKRKTVINYRSGEAPDHLRRWRTARSVLQHTDCVVVPSGYLEEVFKVFGLETQVVPNFVDLDQFQFRPRQPLRPTFMCPRGFHPYYRVDLVVRAFSHIQKQSQVARLCLLGRGPAESHIRSLVDELGLDGVAFAGTIPRREIGRVYDRNDIFINASRVDNMPVSILEAFASGTPVVTTAPEGIGYIVEHERTGLLCDPGDWLALAENALRLLREPELAQRIANNAYEESRRYRWESVRSQWLAVYRRLLADAVSNN